VLPAAVEPSITVPALERMQLGHRWSGWTRGELRLHCRGTDGAPPGISRHHCLLELQVPEHPSERWNVPVPLRPDTCPELMTVMPL